MLRLPVRSISTTYTVLFLIAIENYRLIQINKNWELSSLILKQRKPRKEENRMEILISYCEDRVLSADNPPISDTSFWYPAKVMKNC